MGENKMSEKLPSIRIIRNTFDKLEKLENQLSELMILKGFEGGFVYRADESSLCFEWDYENDNKVSHIKTQKELDYLLNCNFEEAVCFLKERSI